MILNSNSSSIKEKQDFFSKLANKYFIMVFNYWLYLIIFTIFFSTIAMGLEIYGKGWNKNILLNSIIKFTLYISMIGSVYFYHKYFKNRRNFYIYHDFFMFFYIILVSFLQIYNCFYHINNLLQSGKYYYVYADQSFLIFLYVPWMTIFNKRLKIAAIFISDLLLILYTTFINNDLPNIDIFKSFLYFCFKICVDYKLSNIIIILIEDVYKLRKEKRDDNLKWKRIIDEMPIGFIIISKKEKDVLFINNYGQDLLDLNLNLEKNKKNIFDLVNTKIGQLACLTQLQESNTTTFPVMRESIEAVKLLANDSFDQNKRYSLSEILQFVTESKNEVNEKLLSNYLIYLETANNDSNKLAIRIDRNTNFNEVKCFSIFLEDISLKEANKTLKKNYEFQNNLLKSFSHELKTPLNNSIPCLEIGIMSLPQEEKMIQESFLPALKSMKILQLVLNSIIDLNSIISRQFVLNVEKIKLQEFILSLFSLVEPQSNLKHLQLFFTKEEDVAEYIYTDNQRLSIILINLLTNAIKFTFSGKIFLNVSKKSSRSYKFSVIDTGIGISESIVKKMNEYFDEKQKENSNFFYINNSGICLGLNISNKLTHLLSNKKSRNQTGLSVESSPQGSTLSLQVFDHDQAFTCIRNCSKKVSILLVDKNEIRKSYTDSFPSLNLPSFAELEKEIDEVSMKMEKTKQIKYKIKNPALRMSKKRSESLLAHLQQVDEVIQCKCAPILIIDDDPFNQLSLELILKKFKLKCEKANHGLEAIEILKRKSLEEKCSEECNSFKLIFMDYQMPIMNGVEASIKIRELINQQIIDNVSIVGCTAFCTKTEVETFWNAKIDDLVIKPITMSLIQDILKKWQLI